VSKYGDRLLETIEKTINEYYHTDKNSSGSKGSTDSAKRRREANRDPDSNAEGDDDDDDSLIKSTGRSKKRTVRRQIKKAEIYDSEEEDYYHGCLDEDLDCINIEDEALDKVTGTDAGGRVLPQWTAS
jgi:bloom syndrome protein